MKRHTSNFILKVIIILCLTAIGIYFVYNLNDYIFSKPGDPGSEVARKILDIAPEGYRIIVIGLLLLINNVVLFWSSCAFIKKSNPDLVDDQRIDYEKRISKLEYNLALKEQKNAINIEKIGMLEVQLHKRKKYMNARKSNSEKNLSKIMDCVDLIRGYHEEGE